MSNLVDLADLVNRLSNVRHFRELSVSTLYAIVSAGEVRRFRAGSTLYHEGEPCAGLFVLLSGRVHLCRHSAEGRRMIITEIDPVIMFNEVPVLDGGPNPVTAIAYQDCTTWRVSREAFLDLLRHRTEAGMVDVALGLLKVLAARNRSLISRCTDLSFHSVLSRTAKLLLQLSAHGQRPIHRREHTIAHLSERIDTVPEVISRSLSVLAADGLVACTRTTITVLDPGALANIGQVDEGSGLA